MYVMSLPRLLMMTAGTQQQLLEMLTVKPLLCLVQALYQHCAVFERAQNKFSSHQPRHGGPLTQHRSSTSDP